MNIDTRNSESVSHKKISSEVPKMLRFPGSH